MAQFIRVALGSSTELEYQILLSRDLRLLDRELADGLMAVTAQIRAMLASPHRKVVPQRSGPFPPH
jgi:four helix bundle protein